MPWRSSHVDLPDPGSPTITTIRCSWSLNQHQYRMPRRAMLYRKALEIP
jgi:hypothetical protein